MVRLKLPLTDFSLVLTPPLESVPAWAQLAFAIIGIVLTAGLVLWLYSYEVRLIRNRSALGLLALRAVALVLLWFVIMQPVFSRPASERVVGRVLIALDRSD